MGVINDDFETRLAEVRQLFALLEQLSRDNDPLAESSAPAVYRSDYSLKLVKASFFLVLYNLVEATVRNCFSSLWTAIEGDGVPLQQVTKELRSVWLKHEFRQIDLYSASARTYHELALKVLQAVVDDGVPRIVFRNLSGGGNWGLDEIKKVCAEHGLRLQLPRSARGGTDLSTVKSHRNDLAHGVLTFEEVGQVFSTAQLRLILDRSLATLRGLVIATESFLEQRQFLSP